MGVALPGDRRKVAAMFIVLLGLGSPGAALAQPGMLEAEDARAEADRLVVTARADREAVEAELLATMENYQDLSADLTAVSTRIDGLEERIAHTGLEMSRAEDAAGEKAAEAYMKAVSVSSRLVWSTSSLEEAMVAAPTLAMLAGEDDRQVQDLAVTRRDLEDLQALLREELSRSEALVAGVQEEAARLQQLFMEADQTVALAIGEALAADAAYRAALDEVERARVAEEERRRQEERDNTPVIVPTTAAASTSTTLPASTTTSSTLPAPTTPVGPISRVLKPEVERWRSLVAVYFPSDLVDQALSIMQCESLGDPNAYNPYSGASGLFQFIPGTWAVTSVKAGFGGASPFDPEANVAAAAWLSSYYRQLGRSPWTPWHCQP